MIHVIGDVILDRYINGTVDRISPEAPVPVVNMYSQENKLGGAGNVASMLSDFRAVKSLDEFCFIMLVS